MKLGFWQPLFTINSGLLTGGWAVMGHSMRGPNERCTWALIIPEDMHLFRAMLAAIRGGVLNTEMLSGNNWNIVRLFSKLVQSHLRLRWWVLLRGAMSFSSAHCIARASVKSLMAGMAPCMLAFTHFYQDTLHPHIATLGCKQKYNSCLEHEFN